MNGNKKNDFLHLPRTSATSKLSKIKTGSKIGTHLLQIFLDQNWSSDSISKTPLLEQNTLTIPRSDVAVTSSRMMVFVPWKHLALLLLLHMPPQHNYSKKMSNEANTCWPLFACVPPRPCCCWWASSAFWSMWWDVSCRRWLSLYLPLSYEIVLLGGLDFTNTFQMRRRKKSLYGTIPSN